MGLQLAAGTLLLSGCKGDGGDEKEVSPPEDLMQEHGLLNRVLLIYDACRLHLINNESFAMEALNGSAGIIRTFVEDYHEKQEEDYRQARRNLRRRPEEDLERDTSSRALSLTPTAEHAP